MYDCAQSETKMNMNSKKVYHFFRTRKFLKDEPEAAYYFLAQEKKIANKIHDVYLCR